MPCLPAAALWPRWICGWMLLIWVASNPFHPSSLFSSFPWNWLFKSETFFSCFMFILASSSLTSTLKLCFSFASLVIFFWFVIVCYTKHFFWQNQFISTLHFLNKADHWKKSWIVCKNGNSWWKNCQPFLLNWNFLGPFQEIVHPTTFSYQGNGNLQWP